MSAARQPLWTRSYTMALASTVATAMVFFMLVTVMAPYTITVYGLSPASAGFAASAFMIGTVVARLAASKYLDFLGRRRSLIITLALSVVCCVLYLWVDAYPALIALRMVHGLCFGLGNTAVVAGVISDVPINRRAEGTGYFSASIPLGTALGPLVGAALLQREAYQEIFWVCAGLSALSLLLALPIQLRDGPRPPRRELLRVRPSDFLHPGTVPLGVFMFVMGAVFSVMITYVNGYAESGGFIDAMSWFFVVYAGAVLFSRLFVGRIQDRSIDNVVLIPAICCFAVGLGLMAAFPTGAGLLGSAVLVGLGFGACLPAGQTAALNRADLSEVSKVTATFFLMMEAGNGLGPLLIGGVIPVLGFQGTYGVLAAVVLGGLGLYWLVHGRGPGRQRRLG